MFHRLEDFHEQDAINKTAKTQLKTATPILFCTTLLGNFAVRGAPSTVQVDP